MILRRSLLALSIAGMSASVLAQDALNTPGLPAFETIRIIGTQEDAREVTGTGSVIDSEQMQLEVASDIHQMLKTVPGVYVLEEEGHGLRPNIGIRAAASGRSSKVTLLEDGIMVAPAPYSNPAAYYFPTTFRMSALEVLKGAPLLRYGPQTTGGVVNMVSTPIPARASGNVLAAFGEQDQQDLHAHYGDTQGNFGWLLETVQRSDGGFKDIDRSNRDAGFEIADYVAKARVSGDHHSLSVKAQYSEEVSNETYLGLADVDFERDPNRRYGLSEIDQMDNSHTGFSANYQFKLNENITFNAIGYYNEFARDWFKIGGSLVGAANNGDQDALAILRGEQDAFGLGYKHNNRSYESKGIELNSRIVAGSHTLEVGLRDHEDSMDRFQPQEIYDQIDGSLVFRDVVQPTGGNNRLEGADALSLWVTDSWKVSDALNVNLALRYEDVDSYRHQFDDSARNELGSSRSNSTEQWLPGASLTYDLNQSWQLLAGVHKGFSPLGGGATEQQEPETSINYETGVRFGSGQLFAELVGFYSDFSDQAENCSVATPCSNGAESGTFVTGEAVVSGLEFQLSNTFDWGRFTVPVHLSYTHTNAEITADSEVSNALDGDELANIPANMFSLRVELDNNAGWRNYAVAKYTDEVCVSLGCNRSDSEFDQTESLFVVDFVSRYDLSSATSVYAKIENLFDEQVIVARTPIGARPNKPQTASVGIEYSF